MENGIGMADKGLKLSRWIGSAFDLLEMEMLTSHIHMEASPPDDALASISVDAMCLKLVWWSR